MLLEISQKSPLISQKVAQKLLKESQKFLFVAKVAQKLFKKLYRGLCGLFVAASCRYRSHHGQQ